MKQTLDLDSVHSNEDHSDPSLSGEDQEAMTSSNDTSTEEKDQLAKKETKDVFRLRVLVFIVLLLAAVAVSVIVFMITSKGEDDEYRTQYEGAAEKVLEAYLDIAETKLGTVSNLGVASVSHDVDQQWPFATLSNFQQRAATARKLSGSIYINVSPYVTDANRDKWERYVVGNESRWLPEALQYQVSVDMFDFAEETIRQNIEGLEAEGRNGSQPFPIWTSDGPIGGYPVPKAEAYMPLWQTSPVIFGGIEVNRDIIVSNHGVVGANTSFHTASVVISNFIIAQPGDITSKNVGSAVFSMLLSVSKSDMVPYEGDPISLAFFPIFDSFEDDRKPVAVLTAWIHWKSYFENILPSSLSGIFAVLHNTCGSSYTYELVGEEVRTVGEGDLHESQFSNMRRSASFEGVENIADGTKDGLPLNQDHCRVSIDVYPSQAFYDIHYTATPIIMTCAVAAVFLFTALLFVFYDRLVERRQAIVLYKAHQTNAIVSSLFPKNVQERLMSNTMNDPTTGNGGFSSNAPARRLKGYLNGAQKDDVDQAPIADLFPHCTVLFADIAGFTAWSSTRDPAQVFILLQTLYQAFDKIAKRRKVFKVETIGDSYVAVTGVPEPQKTHAVIMARFATEVRAKMNMLMSQLENTLGPDTAELSMRFGIHSGPVTAGVLRGERARFQLFGDTVNTAARMESTGIRNKIQISQATHKLLVDAGKAEWLSPRTDAVEAKGKGKLQTFWLDLSEKSSSSTSGHSTSSPEESNGTTSGAFQKPPAHLKRETRETQEKQDRLVNWIVELLHDHLRKLVASRKSNSSNKVALKHSLKDGQTPLDEVAEVIVLPRFSENKASSTGNHQKVEIDPKVLSQLAEYVRIISTYYHSNPFHNFEHAAHVTMATDKFLRRIVAPDIEAKDGNKIASELHNYTHGINSDPLTLLGIVFSALIHDVDHRGVSNARLAEEEKVMASLYHNKSIAEQNSLDIAWDLLMQDEFEALRGCLFADKSELSRFRQIVVNVVLATDIFDAELNGLRKKRWGKAFSSECTLSEEESNDLRATIVIEHIIQASDVSHTMQHWHVYRKWNQRLFKELHLAYRQGRMGKNPAEFWYHGEIGFFDNYIIPLAKKLKECNIFGVSSDECLNYALENRNEWKEKGEAIVAQMVHELEAQDNNDTVGSSSEADAAKEENVIEDANLLLSAEETTQDVEC